MSFGGWIPITTVPTFSGRTVCPRNLKPYAPALVIKIEFIHAEGALTQEMSYILKF